MSMPPSSPRARQQWLLRVVPMSLIAVLYGVIAVHWLVTMSRELRYVADGRQVIESLLLTVYALQVAGFYIVTGLATLVRKQPLRRERRLMSYMLPFAAMALWGWVGRGNLQDPS